MTVLLEPGLREQLLRRENGSLSFALGYDLDIEVTLDPSDPGFEVQVRNLARRLVAKLDISQTFLTGKPAPML